MRIIRMPIRTRKTSFVLRLPHNVAPRNSSFFRGPSSVISSKYSLHSISLIFKGGKWNLILFSKHLMLGNGGPSRLSRKIIQLPSRIGMREGIAIMGSFSEFNDPILSFKMSQNYFKFMRCKAPVEIRPLMLGHMGMDRCFNRTDGKQM